MHSTNWDPRQLALLLVLSGNMLIDALEVSTMVIALPSIGETFRLSPSSASWLMTGFALGFGSTILAGAWLTQRLGRRRVYLVALLVFAVASVVGGLAAEPATLITSRVVKGVCVALTAPTGLAIIAAAFPEGAARNRALSVYSLFGASGFSVGLLLSGSLTLVSWRYTLLFSGPAALVLYSLARRYIPADGGSVPPPGHRGASVAWPVTAWLARSAAGAAALNGTYWGFLLLITFQLQAEQGWSPLATALVLLPTSVPLALSAGYSGRVVSRVGPSRLIAAGSFAVFLGYLWYFSASDRPTDLSVVLPTTLLVGIGFMLSFAALHIQAVTGVTPQQQPIAGGVYQTSVQVGGAAMLILVAGLAWAGAHAAQLLIVLVAGAGLWLALAGEHRARRASHPTVLREDRHVR